VYLDQNYLSNMAKACQNHDMSAAEREFWKALFCDLKSAVVADRIACPESEFHHEESSLNRKIELAVIRTASDLSLGLEFRPWDRILYLLIEEAAYRFLGKTAPSIESWAIAFTSDPRGPVENRLEEILGMKVRVDVSFSLPDEVVERKRQSKKGWVSDAKKVLKRSTTRSWPEELSIQKRGFVYMLFGPPALLSLVQESSRGEKYDILNASAKLSELYERFHRLTSIGITDFSFFSSAELFNIPFIDVFCSLTAALNTYHANRTLRGSDLLDFAILATAVPYCDVVTTDKFMKGLLVNTLNFDEKYECQIFSQSIEDRQALHEFVRKMNHQ
jgi:hypothetical protein